MTFLFVEPMSGLSEKDLAGVFALRRVISADISAVVVKEVQDDAGITEKFEETFLELDFSHNENVFNAFNWNIVCIVILHLYHESVVFAFEYGGAEDV